MTDESRSGAVRERRRANGEATARPTTDQLHAGIDHSGGRRKPGRADPGTVPLGTDAEAGGSSPTAEERLAAYLSESDRGRADVHGRMSVLGWAKLGLALLVLFAGAGLAALLAAGMIQ